MVDPAELCAVSRCAYTSSLRLEPTPKLVGTENSF